jgi:hypothetical protein
MQPSFKAVSPIAGLLAPWFLAAAHAIEPTGVPSLDVAMESKRDLWGEAGMRQSNGASYEFFENLLPPPRYVNADFRFYPIILSAPNARVKARLVSNGSGVNLRGGSRSWNEVGTPVTFRVGPDEFRFGEILERVSHPTLPEGYLPIPQIRYRHGAEVYELEAFASTDPALAESGVVFVKFSLAGGIPDSPLGDVRDPEQRRAGGGTNGLVTVEVEGKGMEFDSKLGTIGVTGFGTRSSDSGAAKEQIDKGFDKGFDKVGDKVEVGQVVYLDSTWVWERQRAHTRVGTNKFATLAIATRPISGKSLSLRSETKLYEIERAKCVATWEELLALGMNIETPEPLVNNAWRNLVIQNFSLINRNRMNYSAGNQYEKMYAAESSDSALPILWWGYEKDFKRVLPVILDLTDKRLPHHFAGHKLANIPRFYWQTRDAEFVKAMRPRWQKELDLILNDRTTENGLLSKENYCTDIEVPVYSFTADAQCWAALRDMAPVLEEIGDVAQANHVREASVQFKKDILAAVEKNTRREIQPPFIPMAFFHTEDIHDPITETRLGSYWDLVANYVIGSQLFAGSERELWLPQYMEQHGGLFMGLTRSAAANHTFWTGKNRTNPLYGMRYILDCLRRDDVERGLVSFYGMLAQGMTRNTFIGAEGCSTEPLDEGGRFFYCPPNSSSNAQWLSVLRSLLVHDLDIDEDGRPDTLRLLFGTPRRWIEDGKKLRVERAPTAFGPVSVFIESRLALGEVVAKVDLPQRNRAQRVMLRARLPQGWHASSATVGGVELKLDEQDTLELTQFSGTVTVQFHVRKNQSR